MRLHSDLTHHPPGPLAQRPIDGVIAPADGIVVGSGPISRGTILQIKGIELDLRRLVTGRGPAVDMTAYAGGRYFTTFLPPNGYRRVHAPIACTVVDLHWVPGSARSQSIARTYERNERVSLRCRTDAGHEFILVMVGASQTGGIHLAGRERREWAHAPTTAWGARFQRGDELGQFSCGSTVVMLVPPALAGPPPATGSRVRTGDPLW